MIYLYFILVFIFGYYIGRKSAINKLFISESKAFDEIEKEMDKMLTDMEMRKREREAKKNAG